MTLETDLSANFSDFTKFLANLPIDNHYEKIFVFKSYLFWDDKLSDVIVKIINHSEYYTLNVKIPWLEKWQKVTEGLNKEFLLSNIYDGAIKNISVLYKKYNLIYKIHQGKLLSVSEKEKKHNRTFFDVEYGPKHLLKIWCHTVTESEIQNRVGKDNFSTETTKFNYYFTYGDEDLIIDNFLNDFLPENRQETFKEFIFTSSHSKLITEDAFLDSSATEEFKKKYDSYAHYKFLNQNSREKRSDDHISS